MNHYSAKLFYVPDILLKQLLFYSCSSLWLKKIKTPNARKLLILNFAAINLFYLTSFPSSAPKLERIQGFTPAIKILKELKIKEDDKILIYWFDKDYFEKYYDFEKTKVFAINKDTYYNYVSASNNLKTS